MTGAAMSARLNSTVCFTRRPLKPSLPPQREAEEVRVPQGAQVAPGVVESELQVALAVGDPAAQGRSIAGEAAGLLARREPGSGPHVELVVGLNRIAAAGGEREARVA